MAGILLVAAFALLYALTIDTGFRYGELGGGDLITHQYAQVQARPGNAPGYPLYTMGGWAWFHGLRSVSTLFGQPVPNPIPILSSYSTAWALLGLWLLYGVLCRITSARHAPRSMWGGAGNWPLALLLTAFFGVTYFFWYYATTTEQYTSAVAQTVAILLVYLLWQEADKAAGAQAYGPASPAGRLLIALAFLNGLSLAHMLTVALIVPPMVAAILWQRPSLLKRGGLLTTVVAAAALPLTAYLYVWLRGAANPQWWGAGEWSSASEWFLAFISTAQGREELSWGLEAGRPFLGGGFPEIIWQELSIPILLIGLAGIAVLKRPTAFMLYGTLLLYALFCWAYRFGNWYQVILPAYPLILIGAAAALDRMLAGRRLRVSASVWLHAIFGAALIGAVLWRASASLPEANSRNRDEDIALDRAAILLANVPQDAALFAVVDDTLALDYLTSIRGVRDDVILVTSRNAAEALRSGRPLLGTWEAAPTLLSEVAAGEPGLLLKMQGWSPDWVQILNTDSLPGTPPYAGEGLPFAPAQMADQTLLDGRIILDGWAILPAPDGAPLHKAEPALDVWFAWSLPDGWPEGVSVSIRPLLSDGTWATQPDGTVIAFDSSAPMRGLASTAPDPSFLIDAFRLPLPNTSAPPVAGISLIFYQPDNAGGFTTLEELTLPLLAPTQATE